MFFMSPELVCWKEKRIFAHIYINRCNIINYPIQMKKLNIFLTLALLVCGVGMNAQINVPFSTNAQGKSLPIEWGMDAAWDWDYNVMRGVAHYGTNFTTGRISFQPYNLVDASKINDASANFGLSAGQVRKLQWRIDLIKRTGATKVNINCDHEVLVRAMDDEGNYGKDSKVGEVNDNVGKGNYVGTSRTDLYRTTEWVNLIKATVKYAQAQGLEVISVSPFNESDYGWNQYYNGGNGTSVDNQNNYGIPIFKAIAKAIKEDSFFNGIRVCGGNTLNCDRASAWYEGLKPYVDEGNTHQLAGSFDNYASFFKKVRDDGKVATADELHNVGEAMVGVEYGMQNGIWWGFDSKARGQFMHDSNEGVRLGYAEDRSHWTSAAVYRNDKDGEIHGFIGSSERQANVSTYNFQCQDREVYFNGYGPQKEWSVTTVGGADKSYQNGQINYERLFDITYGEDVQSFPVDGNYQIMSAADMKLVTSNGAWSGNNHLSAAAQANNNNQRWHVYPGRSDGDCSYWFIDNFGDATQHWNLLDGGGAGALAAGSRVICYNAGHDALEQWYLRYAKDGYFYIMARQSNKYLYNDNGTLTLQDAPTKSTGANTLKKYMWRLMPTDATAEQTAPATPSGLAEGITTSTSANISWTAVDGESKAVTYNVLRQDANGWNTIARLQSETSYTDTKVEAGKAYRYKVQAVDYSGNRSEMSDAIMVMVPTYTEGQWEWIGETSAAGSWYLYNVGKANFLAMQSDHKPYINTNVASATLFTTTNANSSSFKYSDGKDYYLYHSAGTVSESTTALTWTISPYNTGYQLKTSAREGWSISTTTRGLVGNDAGSTCSVSKTAGDYNSANGTWFFISPSQMTKYGKMPAYTTAFNAAAGYLSKNISSDLKTRLESTLDACDGTINKDIDIDNYITQLNAIAIDCQNCLNQNPSDGDNDFTGLIINPTIIQNGTVTDLPTGWNAAKHQTDNGNYTQGVGNTRLEAWTGSNDIDVDYYQTVVLPNGLYVLTADTHQDADGNACIYGEAYKSFETKMNVGAGIENEATSSVENILVTDGTLRIGMKINGPHNWITADNFTLTRVSTPENTDLSHYTDAIAYLNSLANVELNRNVDHTELNAAREVANSCEANANAYSKAINNYLAAIKRSQAMEELPTAEVGADMTGLIVNPTIQQDGGTNDAPNGWTAAVNVTGNGHYTEGTGDTRLEAWHWAADLNIDYYQIIENLPNGEYKLTAVTHQRENGNACLYAKSGSSEYSTKMPVGDGNQAVTTVTNIPVTDGTLQIGMKASGAGNWVTADNFTLTYLGIKHDANLKVRANVYGTFVAPYDVTLPKDIIAYQAKRGESSVKLTKIAEGDETLSARTPVILKNTTDADIIKDYSGYCDSENLVSDGVLAGFLQDGQVVPNGAYVLQDQNDGNGQMFYKVNEENFPGAKNRCYLIGSTDAGVKVLNFEFADEEETLIEEHPSVEVASEYYSVNGVKLSKPQKGINIVRMSDGTVRKVMER